MSTLISVSALGIVCLILEILNLRKILVPLILLGLAGILGLSIAEFCLNTQFIEFDTFNMIKTSGFSQGFSILFILLAMFIVMMSPRFYEDRIVKIADYVSLIVFILSGAIAMVSFGNLAMFFIGLEVLSIAGYILASSKPTSVKSNEAGMKYFIMGALASSFILFGIALIYGAVGSFNIDLIKAFSATNGTAIWFQLGFVMITVGMLFKASIVPFHFWAPDVYQGSPTLVTALMSTLIKVTAIAALFKIVYVMSAGITQEYKYAIVFFSILSMTVGNITALKQANLKRMMAFSGISHAGFMIMDLLTNDLKANTILYYSAAYSLAAIAGFAVIMAVCKDEENKDISNVFGLARRKPVLAGILACAMLSLGGVPIFAGFFAKLFLFTEMFNAGYFILVAFGVINSIIAIFYYFGTANVMFSKDSISTTPLQTPSVYTWVASIAIILNILLGIFPSVIMSLSL